MSKSKRKSAPCKRYACKSGSDAKCKFCNEPFCDFHLKAKLPEDSKGYWERMAEREWEEDDGHPCIVYAEQLKAGKLELARIESVPPILETRNHSTESIPPKRLSPKGICPLCDSALNVCQLDNYYYLCSKCGAKFDTVGIVHKIEQNPSALTQPPEYKRQSSWMPILAVVALIVVILGYLLLQKMTAVPDQNIVPVQATNITANKTLAAKVPEKISYANITAQVGQALSVRGRLAYLADERGVFQYSIRDDFGNMVRLSQLSDIQKSKFRRGVSEEIYKADGFVRRRLPTIELDVQNLVAQ